MTVPVSEVYGPVLQGEGPHLGKPVHFLRLGLCNLSCDWCDTPYTWDTTRFDIDAECPPATAAEVIDRLPNGGILVLSGGEPMMHRGNSTLATILSRWPGEVHVETNGTLSAPKWLVERVAWWSVSPKLSNSGDRESKRIKPTPLGQFRDLAIEGQAGFKFVAASPDDLDEVEQVVTEFDLPASAIWIMPEGTTAEQQLDRMRALYPAVVAKGWNLAPRLHVLIHGNERGV